MVHSLSTVFHMNSHALKRWMVFVDGENLSIRAKTLDRVKYNFDLQEGKFYRKDVFIWMPTRSPLHPVAYRVNHLQPVPIRAYYYTSVVGDSEKVKTVEKEIRELGFQPRVFKKPRRSEKSKGVDIALATDFLSNAFLDNYDAAILVAGDGDYQ